MLGSQKIVAFSATRDSARAKAFFGSTLGLRLINEDTFALVFDANGIMLRVTPVQAHTPAPYTVLGWEVEDIESKVKELAAAGVVFERFDGLPQDENGIWSTPGARVAWFKDPDGNILSLSQH